MTSLEKLLTGYFVEKRPTLDDIYKWKIPNDVPFGSFDRGTLLQ